MRTARLRVELRLFSRHGLWSFRMAVLAMMVGATVSLSNAATSRLYPPSDDEAGGLRLVQVIHLGTRQKILNLTTQRHLHDAGIKDSDFKDGSLAVARIYCCHSSTDEGTAIWFYVPPDQQVKIGDLVVVRMGRKQTKNDTGRSEYGVPGPRAPGRPEPPMLLGPTRRVEVAKNALLPVDARRRLVAQQELASRDLA
jgi:hypothetical protein